jgi:DNA polymerase III delta subunit
MILLVHGDDSYRVLQKVKSIKEYATTKKAKILEYDFLDDGSDIDIEQITKEWFDGGLFPEKKLIVLKNVFDLDSKDNKLFKKRLQSKISTDINILLISAKKLPKSNSLYKFLKEKLTVKEDVYEILKGAQLNKYVRSMVSKHKVGMDREVENFLVESAQSGLYLAEMNLNKMLNLFAGEEFFTKEMLNQIYIPKISEKIFKLSEYVFLGDKGKGIRLLDDLQREGQEGLMVFGYLRKQIKQAVMIKESMDMPHINPPKMNPYALDITKKQIKNLTQKNLIELYNQVLKIEKEIKLESGDTFEILKNRLFL